MIGLPLVLNREDQCLFFQNLPDLNTVAEENSLPLELGLDSKPQLIMPLCMMKTLSETSDNEMAQTSEDHSVTEKHNKMSQHSMFKVNFPLQTLNNLFYVK